MLHACFIYHIAFFAGRAEWNCRATISGCCTPPPKVQKPSHGKAERLPMWELLQCSRTVTPCRFLAHLQDTRATRRVQRVGHRASANRRRKTQLGASCCPF